MTYLAAVFASALVLSLSAVGLYRLNIKTDAASEYAAEGIAEVLSKRGSTGTEVINIQKKLKNWGYYTGSGRRHLRKIDGGGRPVFSKDERPDRRRDCREKHACRNGHCKHFEFLLFQLFQRSEPSGKGDLWGSPGRAVCRPGRRRRCHSEPCPRLSLPENRSGRGVSAGAFDVVADGQINLTPDSTAYQAAQDAMNGWDPTYGCLYYYNPRTATNQWIKSLPISVTIGNHVFCKGT